MLFIYADLVRNPSALNNDEVREINRLDNMNDMFMNPGVTSETRKQIKSVNITGLPGSGF